MWFFDLDNTLHDASWRIFGALNRSMTDYMMHHLAIGETEAAQLRASYWLRYGATLIGLVRHHGVNAQHFLRSTHAFAEEAGFASQVRAEHGLGELLRRLPGRKVLLTNAPHHYTGAILRHIGLHRHFHRRYTIETMRIHQRYRPKPVRSMLRVMLARERTSFRQGVLIEDTVGNLRAARAVGMRTVWVTSLASPLPNERRISRPTYVDLKVKSVMHLTRRRRFLR